MKLTVIYRAGSWSLMIDGLPWIVNPSTDIEVEVELDEEQADKFTVGAMQEQQQRLTGGGGISAPEA